MASATNSKNEKTVTAPNGEVLKADTPKELLYQLKELDKDAAAHARESELLGQLEDARQALADKTTEYDAIITQLHDLKNAKSDVESAKSDIEGKLEEMTSAKSTVQKALDKELEAHTQSKTDLEQVRLDKLGLKSRIEELDKSVSELKGKLDAQGAAKRQADTKASFLVEKLTAKDKELGTLREEKIAATKKQNLTDEALRKEQLEKQAAVDDLTNLKSLHGQCTPAADVTQLRTDLETSKKDFDGEKRSRQEGAKALEDIRKRFDELKLIHQQCTPTEDVNSLKESIETLQSFRSEAYRNVGADDAMSSESMLEYVQWLASLAAGVRDVIFPILIAHGAGIGQENPDVAVVVGMMKALVQSTVDASRIIALAHALMPAEDVPQDQRNILHMGECEFVLWLLEYLADMC